MFHFWELRKNRVKRLKEYLLGFFYFFIGSISAQKNLQFTHYGESSGLSHYQTWSMFEDYNGFYWIGSTDGLNRFDGSKFSHYFHSNENPRSIFGNVITNITETFSKQILVGTSTGLSIFNQNQNSFSTVFIPPKTNSIDNIINFVLVDHYGFIWVACRFRIFVLNQKYQIVKTIDTGFAKGNDIYRIQADSWGNVWVNASGFLHKINSKNGFLLESKANSSEEVYQLKIADFCISKDGKLHLAETEKNGIYLYTIKSHSLLKFLSPPIKDVRWLSIFNCPSGNIWLTSKDHGIFRISSNKQWDIQKLVHDSQNPNSICSNEVDFIYEDSYQNTWFGTEVGLDMLPKELIEPTSKFEFPIKKNGSTSLLKLSSFQSNSSTIWLTTWGNGLCEISRKSGKFSFYSPSTNDKDLFMTDICQVDSELWIGSYNGCYKYSPGSKKIEFANYAELKQTNTENLAVFKIQKDFNQNFWISFTDQNGILFLNKNKSHSKRFTLKQLGTYYFPFRNFSAIAQALDGNVYFGYNRSPGLARFKVRENQFELIDSTSRLFFNEQINCLLSEGPYLWIGNNSGLCRIEVSSGKKTKLTRENGLPGSIINTLFKDPNGFIWLGSQKGLSRIDPKTQGIIHFNLSGLSIAPNIQHLSFNSELGQMEALSDFHFFSFKLPKDENLRLLHKPIILSCSVAGEFQNPREIDGINFSENDRLFSVEFSCPINPVLGKPRYSYMLKGFDKDWNFSGHIPQAIYTLLPPGDYTLHVRASIDGVNWIESEQTLEVHVEPLFYKSIWFIAILVIIPMLIIMFILHYRNKTQLKNLRLIQSMRNRIADDLHDDIASTLSSISFMSEFAKTNLLSDQAKVNGLLSKIGEHSRQLVSDMSDIVWSVNPSHDNFDSLKSRMIDFAASILQDKESDFEFDVKMKNEVSELNPQFRKNIFLIYKEALHNAVRHASCSKVQIQFIANEDYIRMCIIDNGKGIVDVSENTGNGLRNMKNRAEQIHAKLTITSTSEEGTCVNFTYKFTKKNEYK
jgi:ligand-binding sensor domain-containing protein/two-component sensor histidine kinase